MPIHKLTAKKNQKGQTELRCPDCGGSTERQQGIQDRDQLAYVLSCSQCQALLGEWTTRDEMQGELDAFLARSTFCESCKHPKSDHVEGHCNGLKARDALANEAGAVSAEALCDCTQFK